MGTPRIEIGHRIEQKPKGKGMLAHCSHFAINDFFGNVNRTRRLANG